MMEHWYRFRNRDAKPLYGYRTLDRAFDFAQRLNRTASITYSTKQLTDEEAQELSLDDNTEAFSLTLALAAKD